MFKRLQTKLAVLYVALFTGVLALVSIAVFIATTQNVERVVSDQLLGSGVIFDNLLETQRSRMQEEADVLSSDFGFRAAVATSDAATVRSALDNLATRSKIDLAFVIDMNGAVTSRALGGPTLSPADLDAVQNRGADHGVASIGGNAYEVVAAPLLTPAPAGFVVFARLIGPDALRDLTKLSSLPLQPRLFMTKGGRWGAQIDDRRSDGRGDLAALIGGSSVAGPMRVSKLRDQGDGSLLLIRRLTGLSGGAPVALVLQCPLDAALRPFHALGALIGLIGGLGLLMIVAGSWLLARTLTRPIFALDDAARRLKQGEAAARVTVGADDELGRLGQSFNAMADEIVARQASLTRALASAEAANEAKSIFLANMNHEVRTPLNGVLGVAGMMAATPLDANQRQMVEIIETSGAALQRILNDVLDMVDIGSDDLDLVDEPFALGALLRALADTASAQAVTKGLNFKASIAIAEDVWTRGDVGRVRQILVNILDNAVKFTSEGEVSVIAERDPRTGLCRIEVRDTGAGFDPLRTEELFTAFNQADGSMTRRAGGTGLGLSLARDIARAMGGDIVGDGALGEGAVFVFTVPLDLCAAPVPVQMMQEAPATADLPAFGGAAPGDGAARVLLADDHPSNRIVIEMILGGLDVEVVSVEDGAEAVDAFKHQDFDVVLMDLQMPVMDGLTAIKHIRAYERETLARRTPILVISANVQAVHLRASAEAGADSHLAKPILAPTLIQALNDHLAPRAGSEVRDSALVFAG